MGEWRSLTDDDAYEADVAAVEALLALHTEFSAGLSTSVARADNGRPLQTNVAFRLNDIAVGVIVRENSDNVLVIVAERLT